MCVCMIGWFFVGVFRWPFRSLACLLAVWDVRMHVCMQSASQCRLPPFTVCLPTTWETLEKLLGVVQDRRQYLSGLGVFFILGKGGVRHQKGGADYCSSLQWATHTVLEKAREAKTKCWVSNKTPNWEGRAETGERQRNKTKTIETRTIEHIVTSQRCKATGTENWMQEATGKEVRAYNRRNNNT